MPTASRRNFLGLTVAVGAVSLIAPTFAGDAATLAEPVGAATDERVAALIALSRDAAGKAHIDQVAFVTRDGVGGTLAMAADEVDALRGVLASGDLTPFQQRGVHVDGRKFVFIRDDEGGRVVHAVRPGGEFVTVRVAGSELIVATCADGMAHPRAVEAVYQLVRRAPLAV